MVLINNHETAQNSQQDIEVDHLLACLLKELPMKKAAAVAAEITGARKNELYQRALELKAE